MMKRGRGMLLLGVGIVIFGFAMSARGDEKKATDNMQITREAMQAEKKLFVAANMQLSEDEAQAFWPIYERYQQELQQLNDRHGKLIEEYSKQYNSLSDEKAQELLDEALTIEAERQKALQKYLPAFRDVLPVKKVARYFQIENKIQAVVNYDLAAEIPLVE